MRALTLSLIIFLAPAATPAVAHELWIEPVDYRPAANSKIAAHIVNGEKYKGFNLAYLPRKFKTFITVSGSGVTPVEGRIGDSPALQLDKASEGLHVVVYQSTPDTVTYRNFDKFQSFANHKDFPGVGEAHSKRGLPDKNFREVYTRYSKSLVGVGRGAGQDSRTGLETEIIALDNPYTDDLSDGMRVQLWYGDDVRADAQVELFEKSEDGEITITLHRTDIHGIAVLPVKLGHEYMVDAVVLREPDAVLAGENNAVWETLWANMTFEVPAR